MKRRQKILVALLCLIAVAASLLTRNNLDSKQSLIEKKTEIREQAKTTAETKEIEKNNAQSLPPSVSAEKQAQASPFTGRLTEGPTEMDYLAQIARTKDRNLIDIGGTPSNSVIFAITGWQDTATRRIEVKLKAAIKEISVILKRRNEAVEPLPWKIGTKAHLKGLEPDELAKINSSLQVALEGEASKDIIGEIIKRFRVETKVYTHSLDAEAIESINKDNPMIMAGGLVWIPKWYRVVEIDQSGTLISDIKATDGLGTLGNQYLPTRL